MTLAKQFNQLIEKDGRYLATWPIISWTKDPEQAIRCTAQQLLLWARRVPGIGGRKILVSE